MESAASREKSELQRQQAIQRQIAQLQAQLSDPNHAASSSSASAHAPSLEESTKRKRPDTAILAPASPQHRPSNVLSKLSALSKRAPSPIEPDAPVRTSSFADKASGVPVPARDDRLMLMEELEPGPYEHKPPFDDPLFGRFEPHSGIRLVSRDLPYEDLQAYMTGRYYISPSRLYSVLRAQPGGAAGAKGQVYDVPVVGDWVTIAVVAERSPVRVSRAPVAVGPGEARDADDPDPTPTSSVPQLLPEIQNRRGGKVQNRPLAWGGKSGAPNILALTPDGAGSVAIIGTARDLGMCGVVKRDGKPCGSWFDKRISDLGRLAVSFSQVDAGGPTYVVAGHIVAGVAGGKHDMFLKESLGREAQARAARRTNSHDTDVALKRLLARDKEGMKAVQEARRFAMKAGKKQGGKAVVRKEDENDVGDDDDESSGTGDDEENYGDDGGALADRPRPTTTITKSTKNAYSARVIKELGFDPTAKSFRGSHGRHKGQEEKEEKEKEDSRNKIYFEQLRELASCRQLDRIKLGPRPGGRIRSVVSAPAPKEKSKVLVSENERGGHGGGMVDLDESSGDEEPSS
ncbi:hypothetical protein BJV77DRAFT_1072230 [Russula vinacea]|nr:hypothetical protein BJV77DRAFT_1072230 [Russula vinacea]